MFMSTRYSRRPEPSVKIFSVNDSLAKLCEFLTNEFSCSKLITCKYKDFRSTKIRFEQKTRLNNAIWRAWHIQYKQRKKARFLQFAAPFSDESQHSTSQAVILEGKYWRRRLEKVSQEHKKWRRHLEDKLLRSGGLSREQLEVEESGSDTEEEEYGRSGPIKASPSNEPNNSNNHDSFETLCAMYAFPDTLFSSVEKQKNQKNDLEMSLYKDSSGMIQPTLDHLNPCFDELMENFDFLFSADLSGNQTYNQNTDPSSPNILLDQPYSNNQQNQAVTYVKDDHFLSDLGTKKNMDSSSEYGSSLLSNGKSKSLPYSRDSLLSTPPDVLFQSNHRARSGSTPLAMKDIITSEAEKTSSFDELPPQLQAPNLTARLQAAMSTRPKAIPKNNSDSNLYTHSKRKKELPCGPPQVKKPRLRRNTSNNSCPDMRENILSKHETPKVMDDPSQSQTVFYHIPSSQPISIPYTVTSILPKTATSSITVPVLPKYTNPVVPLPTLNVVPAQTILVTPAEVRVSSECASGKNNSNTLRGFSSSMSSLSEDFNNSVRPTTHSVSSVAKIAPMLSSSQQPAFASSSHENQSTVLIHPNAHRSTSSTKSLFSTTDNVVQVNMHQQQPNVSVLPQTSDQQLLALAQLLQSAPAQNAEATMSYLELLQQQLNMMLKQQQEQIQMKYQLQLHAEKMLQQQQQNQLRQQAVVTGFKPDSSESMSTDSFQFVVTSATSSNLKFNLPQQQLPMTTKTYSVSQPSLIQTSSNIAYSSEKNILSSSITSSLPVRLSNSPSGKPLKMSDFMPSASPKVFKKEQQSLVKTLQRMDDPQSSEGMPFYDSSRKTSQSMQPVTTQVFHPTTLDSAMALVSLGHGTMAPLSNESSRSATPPHRSNEPPRFADLNTSPIKNPSKYGDEMPSQQMVKSGGEPNDRNVYIEHRRQCHLSAEQKRRGLIKHAFEELGRILPNTNSEGRPVKLSNASILERTCEHIVQLQQERASCDLRMNQVQQEIDVVRAAINDCQNKLPATGVTVPKQASDNIKKNFFSFCKEMIYMNSKSWIFCVIMKSLFDSYNKCVSTKTVDEFLNSIWRWLDRHCGLPVLRPIVLETLTKLSTSTSILEDPNCLNVLASAALRNEDPTEIISDVGDSTSSKSSMTFSSSAFSSADWESWRK